MSTTLYVLLFVVGLVIGSILFGTIILPVFYMLPKAIYYSVKGKIKPVSVLVVLRTPLVMTAICVMIGVFFPNVLLYLERIPINNGSNVAIILFCISRFLRKSGRVKSDAEFWLSVFQYRKGGGYHIKMMKKQRRKCRRVLGGLYFIPKSYSCVV
ncbi:MAG TPA: hypothetical protein VIM16_21395 [Mucilaginibacter sp.]|jgi:hypothetical protein